MQFTQIVMQSTAKTLHKDFIPTAVYCLPDMAFSKNIYVGTVKLVLSEEDFISEYLKNIVLSP